METCEVLVVGGGPAGSACAGRLRQAGLDVLLLDKADFPRQKACAGWITPAVLDVLALDTDEYRQGRVLQEISSFRTGIMDGASAVTRYDTTVSYGIRRSEFDHYLLERSGVRRSLGEAVTTLERTAGGWLVNGRIAARMLVGAGGHFCPVARLLGAEINREDVVAAQVTECRLSPDEENECRIEPGSPTLLFCRDMKGYGWLLRKGSYLNIGLGRLDPGNISRHTMDFLACLKGRGDLPSGFDCSFKGHAYRLYEGKPGRTCVVHGALLIGDSAGIADPHSGEGILPAIESGLMAAETICAAAGDYRRDNLDSYSVRLAALHGGSSAISAKPFLCSAVLKAAGARLLSNSWFARHVVLDRLFLHAGQKTLNWGLPGRVCQQTEKGGAQNEGSKR